MVPSPPRLEDSVGDWSDEELFWIVKNGFKYTGMPAWPAQGRDDEVWTQVAFLRALPDITAATYADLALGGGTVDYDLEAGGQALVALDGIFENALENCARCQGRDGLGQGQGAASGAFPIIAGQPAPYLSATLQPSRKAGVKAASCSLPQAVMMRRPSLNLPNTLPGSPARCRNPAPTRVPTGTQRHRHLPAGPAARHATGRGRDSRGRHRSWLCHGTDGRSRRDALHARGAAGPWPTHCPRRHRRGRDPVLPKLPWPGITTAKPRLSGACRAADMVSRREPYVIYAYSLLLIRWVGGRGIAQMSTVEFLLVIALGSAVGDAIFYPEVPGWRPRSSAKA